MKGKSKKIENLNELKGVGSKISNKLKVFFGSLNIREIKNKFDNDRIKSKLNSMAINDNLKKLLIKALELDKIQIKKIEIKKEIKEKKQIEEKKIQIKKPEKIENETKDIINIPKIEFIKILFNQIKNTFAQIIKKYSRKKKHKKQKSILLSIIKGIIKIEKKIRPMADLFIKDFTKEYIINIIQEQLQKEEMIQEIRGEILEVVNELKIKEKNKIKTSDLIERFIPILEEDAEEYNIMIADLESFQSKIKTKEDELKKEQDILEAYKEVLKKRGIKIKIMS